jgi:hypothetical protein
MLGAAPLCRNILEGGARLEVPTVGFAIVSCEGSLALPASASWASSAAAGPTRAVK